MSRKYKKERDSLSKAVRVSLIILIGMGIFIAFLDIRILLNVQDYFP